MICIVLLIIFRIIEVKGMKYIMFVLPLPTQNYSGY